MSDIVNKFIYVFKSLIENIKLLCPKNSIINNNANLIDSFVNNNKDLIIRIYCAKVLIYEVEFNKNPNEFLLTHDFGEDFKELNEVPIDQIFTFKNIWNSLSDENKNILINLSETFDSYSLSRLINDYLNVDYLVVDHLINSLIH